VKVVAQQLRRHCGASNQRSTQKRNEGITVADVQTIGRIGDMLKNIYGDGVVQLQNQAAVIRKKFTKTKAVRVSGDHYEFDVRVGGNRGAVGARLSDDPMPVAKRQRHKKAQVFDRAVFATIKLYDKDIENAEKDEDSFVNHLDDEMENVVLDFMKHMNIITYGDGTGILATVNANTAASNQFVGKTGTAFGQFGTRYLMLDDQIDVFSSDFTVKRTPVGGVAITAVDPTTRTVTVDQNLTLTQNDIVVRYNSANKEYVGLQLAGDNSSSVTFENISRATFPRWRGNVVDAAGQGLSEVFLQQIFSLVEIATGQSPNNIVTHNAQWDRYAALGTSLKRFMTTKIDMGFQTLDYLGTPFTKDVDAPPMIIHVFKDDGVQNGVTKPLGWLNRDGSVLKWVSGYAAWTAILAEYGNYVYPNPQLLGRVQGLAVDNVYLA
jgi:hypothetical protein